MKELSLGRKPQVPGGGEPARSGVERSGTERSDGSPPPARSTDGPLATGAAPTAGALSPPGAPPAPPDPEVLERPMPRRYTAEYKLRILLQADRCDKPGEVGALLRREGLYSSLLSSWRKQRDAGALGALKAKKRGPAAVAPNPLQPEVARLEKEKRHLERKLKKAEAIIEFQKKIAALLDIPMKPFVDEEID